MMKETVLNNRWHEILHLKDGVLGHPVDFEARETSDARMWISLRILETLDYLLN